MFWSLMKNTITDEDKQELLDFVKNSDRFTNGPKVREFEKRWSEWLGTKHTLMVSSGSTANYLLLSAVKELYGLEDGTKVLVPAITWVTNISPVFQLGMQPVFCDVNPKNFSFDREYLLRIKEEHPDIKVLWITHLLGFASDVEMVKEIFPEAIVLEDVCESHGTEIGGEKCGTFGEGSTHSFYYGHHMTTVEGGVVSTDNYDLYNLMRAKRSHGLAREMDPKTFEAYQKEYPDLHPQFLFVTDAYNFRSSEFNAVLGLSQLKRLSDNVEQRRKNFDRFLDIICKYDCLFADYQVEGNSNFNLPFYCDTFMRKEKLEAYLNENGVETRPIISGNLTRQPFLKFLDLKPEDFPNADDLHFRGFYIGNNHLITDQDFDKLEELLENYKESLA